MMKQDKQAQCFFAVLLFSVLTVFALLPGAAISGGKADSPVAGPESNPSAGMELSIRIIPGAGETFGYDILRNGKPFIHQPNVPGLPGNEGFKTREGARKVAELVAEKIRNGVMPPSVSVEELKRLGVLE